MRTNLRVGDMVAGFEILELVALEELNALGIRARHIRTGADLAHVYNDDEENLFSFAFATPSTDSTGVAHILEHSVLCGSRSFPLKDAFMVLAQGSLQTFLNAMTFPDKTVYPASSTNKQDYFNLMAVYGDSVFRPRLEEWTFRQEGHRLEFVTQDEGQKKERLIRTGVVYNEMKGNYSSPDSIAADWTSRSVLSDTSYAFDSGGDPDDIPRLTWDSFKAFHTARYNPANCRIFLCGNIPTEEQLEFLDKNIFVNLDTGVRAPVIEKAERWNEPRRLSIPCPASVGLKSTVFLSWLCSDSTDMEESIALAALAETLLGHDGAPLTRALVESHLGEDLAPSSGLEGNLRETVFSVGLRGVDAQNAERVDELIIQTLSRLVSEGIPKEEIEAALLSLEFANREIRRAGGPYSLVWMNRSLRAWLHGSSPWTSLLFIPAFTELKRRLAEQPDYFESLITSYFLTNPHRALVSVEPEAGYSQRKESDLAAELERHLSELSEAEKKALWVAQEELLAIQSAPDDPVALKAIPHLSRSDLDTKVERIPRAFLDIQGLPVMTHELFTNGISYLDFAFPVDSLSPEDYIWLPLVSRTCTSLGLPGMDYGQVSSLMARTVGGFHAMLFSSSQAPGVARTVALPEGILDITGRDWLIFRLKFLEEKTDAALDLALRMLTQADYGDEGRLKDLLLEYRNDFDASLAPSGHSHAISRAGRRFSRSRAVEEIWNGITQMKALHRACDLPIPQLVEKLSGLRDRLISTGGLFINITGSSSSIALAHKAIEGRFSPFGAPKPRSAACEDTKTFFSAVDGGKDGNEVFSSPSLQVGFAALAMKASPYATAGQVAEQVLAHRLSTGALWEDIRMRGGAYGAFAFPDSLENLFLMATYRDPSPRRSLDALAQALHKAASESIGEEELEKAIIGTYSKETRPKTSAEKGMVDFVRFLTGIEDSFRERKLAALVNLTKEELKAASERLQGELKKASSTVLAGSTVAQDLSRTLGTAITELPI